MRRMLAVLVLVMPLTAAAELVIKATPGAGDYVRMKTIAPIMVTLENDGEDRDGRVRVGLRNSAMGQPEVWAVRDVPLPPNARKRLFLYMPMPDNYPDSVVVRYETLRGRRQASLDVKLRHIPPDVPILCGISSLPPGLPPEELGNSILYQRLFLTPETIPDRAEGLEMFDAIFIDSSLEQPLDLAQVEALHSWVLHGGTLVVDMSRPTDALRSGALPEMLPFRQQGVQDLQITQLNDKTTVARGNLDEAEVLMREGDVPLIVRGNAGLGSITCFALPMNTPSFAKAASTEVVWQDILSALELEARKQRLANQNTYYGYQQEQQLIGLVQEEQRTGLRIGVVLVLILLYAVAVGPGDYMLVKRLGKPKLTWVTFPVIVTVFTVGAYYGAKWSVGGEMAAANWQRTVVLPDENVTLKYDLVSLFAPATDDYELAHVDGAFLHPFTTWEFSSTPTLFNETEGMLTQRIPVWQRRVYDSQTVVRDNVPVSLSSVSTPEGPEVTVTNATGYALSNGHILRGDQAWQVRFEPGQDQARVVLAPEAAKSPKRISTRASNILLYSPDAETVDPMQSQPLGAHWRSLSLTDALRRGATIFYADQEGAAESPLIVNGAQRPETGTRALVVVTYKEGGA